MPVYLLCGGKQACAGSVKMQRKSNCADEARFWSSVRLALARITPERSRDPTFLI